MRDQSSGACCIPCATCGEGIGNISTPALAPTAGTLNGLQTTLCLQVDTSYTKRNQNYTEWPRHSSLLTLVTHENIITDREECLRRK